MQLAHDNCKQSKSRELDIAKNRSLRKWGPSMVPAQHSICLATGSKGKEAGRVKQKRLVWWPCLLSFIGTSPLLLSVPELLSFL